MKASYEGKYFGKFSELAENMSRNTYCDEIIAIIQRFMLNAALYQNCIAQFYHDNKKPLSEVDRTIPDARILFAWYHYAGATSNRTAQGTLATEIVRYFTDHAKDAQYAVTQKLIQVFELLNTAAASREKFLLTKDRTVTMEDARGLFRSRLSSLERIIPGVADRKIRNMTRDLPGKPVGDDEREMLLSNYFMIINEHLPTLINDLQLLLANAMPADGNVEKKAEIEALSVALANAKEALDRETEEIAVFSRNAASPPTDL